ncbi:MAG: four helix bundle protein [Candidatus Eisenbacteria bacterium]|nr:four helix bundle protein [Candidatus Eisenbacteria bacterium]
MSEEELPLYLQWTEFLDWLLGRTEKFPRRVRLSISNRLESLALDMLEDIVEARYTRARRPVLERMNLRLEKMRVLLRLCHQRGFLPHDGYEHGFRQLTETGRMVGG